MTITIDGVVREKEKKTIGMSDDKKEDNDHHHHRRGSDWKSKSRTNKLLTRAILTDFSSEYVFDPF